MQINSPANPKIKHLIKLRKSSFRKETGQIIIEGAKEINTAMLSGLIIKELYVCPEIGKDHSIDAEKIVELPLDLFRKISIRENPDGYIALANPRIKSLADIHLSSNPLLVILEGMEKPGNIGAVLRTADAAGVDAVLLCSPKADIYNPNVIRSSLGTVFTNQVIVCDSKEAIDFLKKEAVAIYAATPEAKLCYNDNDFNLPSAIVIGTEHEGLTPLWINEAKPIKIPMKGKIDSLNASVSAAIVLFEAKRQRKFK